MPTTGGGRQKRRSSHYRRALRRWLYRHSEDLPSFWIGAVVVAATLIALKVLKIL
jgi:hypothetical protein